MKKRLGRGICNPEGIDAQHSDLSIPGFRDEGERGIWAEKENTPAAHAAGLELALQRACHVVRASGLTDRA